LFWFALFAVVVMGKDHNISEANHQLGDTTYYKRLDQDPMSDHQRLVSEKLSEMFTSKEISEDNISHSRKSQSRPILSSPQNSQTWLPWTPNCLCKRSPNRTDLRVCWHTPFVSSLPSYVQDTTDYLTKLSLSDISEETWLVSLDVVSLYTNTPHEDGIEACREEL